MMPPWTRQADASAGKYVLDDLSGGAKVLAGPANRIAAHQTQNEGPTQHANVYHPLQYHVHRYPYPLNVTSNNTRRRGTHSRPFAWEWSTPWPTCRLIILDCRTTAHGALFYNRRRGKVAPRHATTGSRATRSAPDSRRLWMSRPRHQTPCPASRAVRGILRRRVPCAVLVFAGGCP